MVCDFPARVFLKHKFKMTCDFCFFNALRFSVDGNHLMHFQSENTVFKVLRRAWYRQGQSVNAVLEKIRGLCLQSEIQNSEHDFRIQQKLEEEVLRMPLCFLRTFKGNENWFENRAVREIRGKIILFD